MKVTVKNPNKKPINISKLAPLMPVMVLGVSQEITVNVRDIDSVMKRAEEIGVTVTPMEALEVTPVVDPDNDITDTANSSENEGDAETHPETNEVTQETTEPSKSKESVDEQPKKKTVRKSAKTGKKTTVKKSIFGNNK